MCGQQEAWLWAEGGKHLGGPLAGLVPVFLWFGHHSVETPTFMGVLVCFSLNPWIILKTAEREHMCTTWPRDGEGHWLCLLAIDVLYMESPACGLEAHVRGWKRPPAPSMEGNHEIHSPLASFRSPTKGTRGVLGKWEVPFKNHFKPWPFFLKTLLLW